MAIETQTAPQQGSNNNRNQKDAEAWLNLRVQDANGNWHSIRGFIPLTSDNNVHKALMVKGQGDENGEPIEIQLVGTVNFVRNEEIVL